MILIVSHEQDPHAGRVLEHLARESRPTLLLNLSELPNAATLTYDYAPNRPARVEYRLGSGAVFSLDRMRSVWWRRPQQVDLSTVTHPDVQIFTANEWNEAINGLWQLLPAQWMNHPVRDEVASRKALQLQLAAQVGLRVPRTLITSDPDKARAFLGSQGIGKTIYKTFSCTHAIWRETRLVRHEDLALLDSVRIAPVIFQEYVPAECDLRITIIGDQIFAAAIRSHNSDENIDFRMRVGEASMQATELPHDIVDKLLVLMNRLGLVYGAIDMRRTPQGDYFFFEVNTAGEFLFVEERTGLPISQAIANWLAQIKPVSH